MGSNDEEPRAQDAAGPTDGCGAKQFTLRGLLWFTVLCSLKCS
jgi:hypothetical protein